MSPFTPPPPIANPFAAAPAPSPSPLAPAPATPATPAAPDLAPAPTMTPKKKGQVNSGSPDAHGFYVASAAPVTSFVVSIWGPEKSGKTTFALSSPGPIVYFNLNYGNEGVSDKFVREGKKILIKDIAMPKPQKGLSREKQMEVYTPIWENFKSAWFYAVENRSLGKSLVLDTADEVYDLVRLARLGALSKVMPEHYQPVYAELEEVLRAPLMVDGINAVYISKQEKEFVKEPGAPKDARSEWNGKYIRRGYKNLPYIAQVNLRAARTPTYGFAIHITDSRLNAATDGTWLGPDERGPDGSIRQMFCSMPMLYALTIPNADHAEWAR